jgi:hypothetical protein
LSIALHRGTYTVYRLREMERERERQREGEYLYLNGEKIASVS